MRRNMVLFRAIMLFTYNHDEPSVWEIRLDQFSLEETEHHIGFLIEDGYLKGKDLRGFSSIPEWRDISFTTRGYNLASVIEDETKWMKIKQTAEEKGEPFTFDFINRYRNPATTITVVHGDVIGGDKVSGEKLAEIRSVVISPEMNPKMSS